MPKSTDLKAAMLKANKAKQDNKLPTEKPKYTQPSRAGKVPVTGHFSVQTRKQLKMIAIDEDTTVQALLTEALNDLFAKKGKPEIA